MAINIHTGIMIVIMEKELNRQVPREVFQKGHSNSTKTSRKLTNDYGR